MFIEGLQLNKTLQILDFSQNGYCDANINLDKILQINAQNQNLTFLDLVFPFHFLKLAVSHFHPVPLMLLTHSGTQNEQLFRNKKTASFPKHFTDLFTFGEHLKVYLEPVKVVF